MNVRPTIPMSRTSTWHRELPSVSVRTGHAGHGPQCSGRRQARFSGQAPSVHRREIEALPASACRSGEGRRKGDRGYGYRAVGGVPRDPRADSTKFRKIMPLKTRSPLVFPLTSRQSFIKRPALPAKIQERGSRGKSPTRSTKPEAFGSHASRLGGSSPLPASGLPRPVRLRPTTVSALLTGRHACLSVMGWSGLVWTACSLVFFFLHGDIPGAARSPWGKGGARARAPILPTGKCPGFSDAVISSVSRSPRPIKSVVQ